jgi:hypothetical protein
MYVPDTFYEEYPETGGDSAPQNVEEQIADLSKRLPPPEEPQASQSVSSGHEGFFHKLARWFRGK